ncbi:Uncharacterized protein PBTT_07795 [Plasmodiophora brassicae]|nr:hypothetical protein PBRA_007718 [Plasmodiophora brassicae]
MLVVLAMIWRSTRTGSRCALLSTSAAAADAWAAKGPAPSRNAIHREVYLQAKARLLERKVDPAKWTRALKQYTDPRALVDMICADAMGQQMSVNARRDSAQSMADRLMGKAPALTEDEENLRDLLQQMHADQKKTDPNLKEPNYKQLANELLDKVHQVKGRKKTEGVRCRDGKVRDPEIAQERVLKMLVEYIRQKTGIYSQEQHVVIGLLDVIAKNDLDEISEDKLYDMMLDNDADRLKNAIRDAISRFPDQIDVTKMEGGGGEDEFEDPSTKLMDAKETDEGVLADILIHNAGLENCVDSCVRADIEERAKKLVEDNIDEDSPVFQQVIEEMRERHGARPGALSDSDWRFRRDSTSLFHDILERSNTKNVDDFEPIDRYLWPVVERLLKDANGDLAKVDQAAVDREIEYLQKAFPRKQRSDHTGPQEPPGHPHMPNMPFF